MRIAYRGTFWERVGLLALAAVVLACAFSKPVQAANILVNGDFEMISVNRSSIFGSDPTPLSWGNGPDANLPDDGIRQTVTGWQTAGYNFVMKPGTIDTTGGADPFINNEFLLWGSNNGGTGTITTSPTGGNFVAADAAYRVAPIYQQLDNLVVGATYTLTFSWAAGQAFPFGSGGGPDTTEGWTVCFGTCNFTFGGPEDTTPSQNFFTDGEIYSTTAVTNPNMGFTPWMNETMTFTATSSSQTLSLLAYGTPLGQPPFALIDGISLDGPLQTPAVPEPTTWMMFLIGFGIVGSAMRKRNRPVHEGRALKQII